MAGFYIIPGKGEIGESLKISAQYQASFEYNDFFMPHILSDKRKQQEIIDFYAARRSDFSKDTIHGAFLDVTLHSEDPLIREVSKKRMYQSMEIAREMGVRGVVFHSGRLYGFRTKSYLENWFRINGDFFRKLLSNYPDQEIWMENMFDEQADILAEFARQMAEEGRFGICLDYAHAVVYGSDTQQWIKLLAPYIRHIHMNDNDGINDLHLSVGNGQINWDVFRSQMEQYQVEATVLIEVSGAAKQRESLEYMQKHLICPKLFPEGEG